jgi:RNA polymerase-binding transcription factor DksA
VIPDTAQALAAKRTQLTEQLDAMTVRPEDAGSISFGKRVGEGTSEAVDRLAAVPAHDKLQVMLAEVIRAEEKIDEGSYGACDVCGATIPEGRLEARPWATRCMDHA